MIVVIFGLKFRFTASPLSTLGKKSFSNLHFCYFLPLSLPFSYPFFPAILFYNAIWYPAVCDVVVFSCLLRKSISDFVSINSVLRFHTFKFYFRVLCVKVYCCLPDGNCIVPFIGKGLVGVSDAVFQRGYFRL